MAPGDLDALARTLETRNDIACVMLEPAGGTHGTVPATRAWVEGVRALTQRHGVILIFDEMVTGFRLAPGGYQGASGIVPDLTTLGKALFGGMPGGAVCGRADLMDLMKAGASPFVSHMGSWNAAPVACASGVATLRMARDGRVHAHINGYGDRIRGAFNEVIARLGISWCFFLNAASFLAVLVGLFMLQLPPYVAQRNRTSPWQGVVQVMRYMRDTREVRSLMLMVTVYSILGAPVLALIPVVAREMFGLSAGGYGLLLSFLGIGGLAGALGLAAVSGRISRIRLLTVASMTWPSTPGRSPRPRLCQCSMLVPLGARRRGASARAAARSARHSGAASCPLERCSNGTGELREFDE
jgi:hypothetical protein